MRSTNPIVVLKLVNVRMSLDTIWVLSHNSQKRHLIEGFVICDFSCV